MNVSSFFIRLFTALLFFTMSVMPKSVIGAIIPEHQSINSWQGPLTCLPCHEPEAVQVFHSVHYQWLGDTPYMTTGTGIQGKLDIGVNSYCINTTGNWDGCGACHVGLGARPQPQISQLQLENIDCLICHQKDYKRVKADGTFIPDTEQMTITLLEAARTVHLPTRQTCLQCHAKGGGGDNFKRGDMALAHAVTADRNFDVHMATSGGNLNCQTCHVTEQHLMAGRGSDLRPTDLDQKINCTDCHTNKDSSTGHSDSDIGRHVTRVACQSCHIPQYARDAQDTTANEMTEIHRDWQIPHLTASGAIHPTPTLAGNLTPRYAWWNGTSSNYLLFDSVTYDPQTGRIPTSRPVGEINGGQSKLYPFKYKTATQPLAVTRNQLIALDTSIYFSSGDAQAATQAGLVNMGYQPDEPYTWVETDTLQLLSHEIAPASAALTCTACHDNTDRIDLTGALGYQLKASRAIVCTQCHGQENGDDSPEYLWIHDKHVRSKKYDCSWCHTFSRPERGLKLTPILIKLGDVINTLRILTGQPPIAGSTLNDTNGDSRIGIAEAIDSLRKAAEL